jgi:thioredoxin 1
MTLLEGYRPSDLSAEAVQATRGPLLLIFGIDACGHCRAAQPAIEAALRAHPGVAVRQIEDGPGRRLGRAFRVKLWPTLVCLSDGREVARVVRPREARPVAEGLAAIDVAVARAPAGPAAPSGAQDQT